MHLFVGIEDLGLQPVSDEPIFAIMDRHAFEPTVAIGLEAAANLDAFLAARKLNAAGQSIHQVWGRARIGNEEGIGAKCLNRIANRLRGLEVIAAADRL